MNKVVLSDTPDDKPSVYSSSRKVIVLDNTPENKPPVVLNESFARSYCSTSHPLFVASATAFEDYDEDIPQMIPRANPFADAAATASSSVYAAALSTSAATSILSNNGLHALAVGSSANTVLFGKLEDNDGDLKPAAIEKQDGECSLA